MLIVVIWYVLELVLAPSQISSDSLPFAAARSCALNRGGPKKCEVEQGEDRTDRTCTTWRLAIRLPLPVTTDFGQLLGQELQVYASRIKPRLARRRCCSTHRR
eukprot:TRINITY_DN38158_c0_g1_i1.p1 TRINITY_DN38158_c0_g1~~TRINITY_DN38158_c0_g1_i1.p1  ORF type:complete len:103 (+),score=5.51 TRINITY_DN38158_c0_g1_i1:527-835(+)